MDLPLNYIKDSKIKKLLEEQKGDHNTYNYTKKQWEHCGHALVKNDVNIFSGIVGFIDNEFDNITKEVAKKMKKIIQK